MQIFFNNIKTITRITINSLSNFIILSIGLILHRDPKVVLFGAWMGERFADNSRFLFQYMAMNKEKYNIKRVIWVTRNNDVNRLLNDNGFESYLIGTKESTYWHLKAGIQVICNMAAKSGVFKPDIDIMFSTGAKKVQLWHGVGIKAVGAKSNASVNSLTNKRCRFISSFSNTKILRRIGYLGGWGEPSLLCTSKLNLDINIKNSNIHPENAFISSYPRYCSCLFMFDYEKTIIDKIQTHKLKILYLPTFRDRGSKYTTPSSNQLFLDFLKANDILWIQKPHQADSNNIHTKPNCQILDLDSSFDVNILLQTVDVIVSDYSSAAFDAIFLDKPVIMYVPDLDSYTKGSNGLLYDPKDLFPSLLAYTIQDLTSMTRSVINKTYYSQERMSDLCKTREMFFEKRDADYHSIWQDITTAIQHN